MDLAQVTYTTSTTDAGASAAILIVYADIGLVFLAVHIFVLMDILKHSDAAWAASGQQKGLWIGLWVLGFCSGGLIIDLIYWFAIRPKLVAAEQGGGGYPPPGPGGYAPQ